MNWVPLGPLNIVLILSFKSFTYVSGTTYMPKYEDQFDQCNITVTTATYIGIWLNFHQFDLLCQLLTLAKLAMNWAKVNLMWSFLA